MPEPLDAVPQWTPTQLELDDLDLLVNRSFEPPLAGFVDPAVAGPASPITLVVAEGTAAMASAVGRLDLIDPEGAPVARLTVQGSWDAGAGLAGLVGPVAALAANEFGPFRRLHLTPDQVHELHAAEDLIAVPVIRPLTHDDITTINAAADETGLQPMLLVCVGEGMPEQVSAPALVRAALEAAALVESSVHTVAVSAADHGWMTEHGDYRSPNDWLLSSVAAAFASTTLTLADEPTGDRPELIEQIVTRDRPRRDRQGAVIFFTGLSGSGKSTLAKALVDHILEQGERTVTSLDGDVVRHHLSRGLGFSREDRETNILRIGYVASEVSRHGGLAICSPIAPFESTRQAVRLMAERAGGGFVLVHVATPLAECERRDRKGLYAKARAGDIRDFTGISSPYEEPTDAIKLDTTNRDIVECLEELTDALASAGWLHS